MTVGTAQRADYEQVSALVAEVAAPQEDAAGIDGNLSVATSTTYVAVAVCPEELNARPHDGLAPLGRQRVELGARGRLKGLLRG